MTTHVPLNLDLGDNQLVRVELSDDRPVELRQDSMTSARSITVAEAATTGSSFNTNGWDTVYAIRLTDVNRAIAAKNVTPAKWSAHIDASLFNPATDGGGSFGTWSLSNGAGTGATIRMHLPFTAQVTVNDTTIRVDGGVAYALVKLIYLPELSDRGEKKLQIRSTGGTNDDPIVQITSVTYTSPREDKGLDNALKLLLEQWCNTNLATFNHVFATVNLGMDAANGAFQWLYPTYTTYAYSDASTLDEALLGVLCMTEQRDHTGAEQTLASGAIPDAARAGFSIAAERFLEKMVLPSLVAEFPQAPDGTFQLANNNTEIDAVKNVPLDPVKYGAVNYHPVMETFRVSVDNARLVTYAYIHTEISPGIDAYGEVTYNVALELGTKDDGTQSLTFRELGEPLKHTWYTVQPWVEGVEIAASIVLAIITAGITFSISKFVSTAARVIVALVVGGVIGAIITVLEKIPEWIAGKVPDALPSVDALVLAATSSTTWSDGKDFGLTNILFNGALQFGGNPGFPAH